MFEVQEWTLSGWQNTWSDDEGKPSQFETEEIALDELEWFLHDMQAEVEAGNMEDAPSRDSFRVVEVA